MFVRDVFSFVLKVCLAFSSQGQGQEQEQRT